MPELKPPAGSWSNYPMTVARRVARNFPGACRGADMALVSDLPQAAGLSSSSALLVSVFLVLAEANQLAARDEYWHNIGNKTDLAGYLGTIENGQSFGTLRGDRGVGTFGGSEDHTAILCAEPDHISQYAYCPVEFEKMLPMPPGHVFAVGTQRHRGRKDRRRAGKIQCRLSVGLGAGRAMAAGDRPRRSAPGGRAGQRAGCRPSGSSRCCKRPTPPSSIAPRWLPGSNTS